MVEVRPFAALHFDWAEVDGGPGAVTSPPYDVLTTDDVTLLKKRSGHNITHLTLPAATPGKPDDTKYEAAAKTLKRWRKEGVLAQRKSPALFVYEETYLLEGVRRTMRGFIAQVGLDSTYETVRPHERTHAGPISDRLELLKATATDLEPIQFLYVDPERRVGRLLSAAIHGGDDAPLVDFTDPSGTQHRLWAVDDAKVLEPLAEWFRGRPIYIADGHHRYATALHYAKLRREEDADAEEGLGQPFDFKMGLLVDRDDPGIAVLPTFRLVYDLEDVDGARDRLAEHFRAERVHIPGDASARAAALVKDTAGVDRNRVYRFVFYWGEGEADIVTVPKEDVPSAGMGSRSPPWKALDVVVLHHVVLPSTLGVDERNAGGHLHYTRIAQEAVTSVDLGEHQCAIFLNATPLAAVTAIADAGEHMPQKSTYFQPKVQSGLVLAPLQ